LVIATTQGPQPSTLKPRRLRAVPVAVLIASAACATPYGYSFHLGDGGSPRASGPGGWEVQEDANVRVELLADPTSQRAILVQVTNKTDQVLQVEWTKVAMTRSDGLRTTPRPDADLGWIRPGETQAARLIPFALPPSGSAALAMQGQRFELEVPMIVRRESKNYRYALLAQLERR
jgi:hypothetical protein